MTTPMNCVKRMSGVRKDHTGQRAMFRLQDKVNNIYNRHTYNLRCFHTVLLSHAPQRKNGRLENAGDVFLDIQLLKTSPHMSLFLRQHPNEHVLHLKASHSPMTQIHVNIY